MRSSILIFEDMIDKLSREGDEARRKLKIIREQHEKVEKMNLEVKQSIDAMSHKLQSVVIETPNGMLKIEKLKFSILCHYTRL